MAGNERCEKVRASDESGWVLQERTPQALYRCSSSQNLRPCRIPTKCSTRKKRDTSHLAGRTRHSPISWDHREPSHLARVMHNREGARLLELADVALGKGAADDGDKLLVACSLAQPALLIKSLEHIRHQREALGARLPSVSVRRTRSTLWLETTSSCGRSVGGVCMRKASREGCSWGEVAHL